MTVSITEGGRRAIEDLVFEWARAIDEGRLEDLAPLLTGAGQYRIASRFNADRGLPLAIVDCRSQAQFRDRIRSIRVANVYAAQHYRHLVSGIQVLGEREGAIEVRSSYMVARIMEHDGSTTLFSTGQYRDRVVFEDGRPRFLSREVIYDSRAIDTLLAIPI